MGIKSIGYSEHMGDRKILNDYLDDIVLLNGRMAEIENITDNNARLVLGYKYLQFKTFEEIAKIMNYSEKQIRRFHKNGISILTTFA